MTARESASKLESPGDHLPIPGGRTFGGPKVDCTCGWTSDPAHRMLKECRAEFRSHWTELTQSAPRDADHIPDEVQQISIYSLIEKPTGG